MQRYILQRLVQGVILLVVVTSIVFFIGRMTGNPVDMMLPEDATEEDRQDMIVRLKLEGTIMDQFGVFIVDAVQGDLGTSIRYRKPATEIFFQRLPNTLAMIPPAMILAIVMAVPLGVISALRRGGIIDRISATIAVLGISTPNFWLGIVLIYLFSVTLGWLPSSRMGGPLNYIMPTITLGTFLVAGFMRLIRSSMLETLDSEFVKLARIKGVSETAVIWKHCLRNALIPVLSLWGVFMGGLVTGAIVTETVFAWPGIGRLTYEAVIFRDYPLLQAVIIMDAIFHPPHQPAGRHSLRLCRSENPVRVGRAMRRLPLASFAIIATMVFVAVFAPWLTPHSPIDQSLPDKLLPPFWEEGGTAKYLLGTDIFGRDLLTRLFYGARVSLIVTALALTVGGGVGLVLGIVSGYVGGKLDAFLMRVVDAAFAFPTILFALLLAVTMGQGMDTLVIALSLFLWAGFARVIRGEVLAIKQRDFVALARVHGSSPARIMFVHILPNVLNTFMVLLTLNVGVIIVAEASLSFLGAGVPPPTPSWGLMVAEGRGKITSAWWLSLIPGIAITLVVLSFNLFGDWLRDRLDPKLRQL